MKIFKTLQPLPMYKAPAAFLNKLPVLVFLSLSFLLASTPVLAESQDEIMQDQVFDPNIKTVQFSKAYITSTYPIMQLNSGDVLTLQWDLLNAKRAKNYQFTIIHCDWDWKKSVMMQSDYINGLFQDYVNAFSFSTNTYVRYIHYKIDFPTTSIKPKISGNYILEVFTDDPDKPVMTKRFYVYEQQVQVSGLAQRSQNVRFRDTKQEVNFTINTRDLIIQDPFGEIKTVIKQNWRWDNEITDLKPTYIRDKSLIYEYQEGNVFDAGNEFRPMDIRDVHYKTLNIRAFIFDSIYRTVAYPDEDRSYTAYNLITDQNGNYTIASKQDTGMNASTTADYINTQFKLSPTVSDDVKNIYVFGALSNWKLDPAFKMSYSARSGYECNVLLKQGFYDYEYVSVQDGKIDPSPFEGNHWETENNYTVLVYYHPPSSLSDLLVGMLNLNTALH